MKRFYDPITEKRISKNKAINIAEEIGKMLTKEKMTISEARKRGYKILAGFESATVTNAMCKNGGN